MLDPVLAALVEVDGPRVGDVEHPGAVDGPDEAPGVGLVEPVLDRRARPQPHMGGGGLGPGPVHPARPGLEGVGQDELPDGVVDRLAEPAARPGAEHGVVGGQGQLVGGAADVGPGHERVPRVHHRRFQRPGEQGGGMVEVPAVELVVARHQDGGRRLEGPPGPPGLLPEGGQRAGEALEDDGVKAGHVDAQLEGVGGGHAEQFPLGQRRLQLAALLGEVAAPVGGDRARQP